MSIKRAERPHTYGTVCRTPEEQFVFVGPGPWFVFEHHPDWYLFGLAEAMNFFARLERDRGAHVEHVERSYVFNEDGRRYYYTEFRVRLELDEATSGDCAGNRASQQTPKTIHQCDPVSGTERADT